MWTHTGYFAMKVLLVSANREHIPDPVFPLGLAYIAAAVASAGHQVAVADLCFGRQPLRRLRQQVIDFQPHVIGVSLRNVDNAAYPLTVDYLPLHRQVIETLRSAGNASIVLGGSGFSIMPRAYMQTLQADWGISGEGEQLFVALLNALAQGRRPPAMPGLFAAAATSPGEADHVRPLQRIEHWGEGLRPARSAFNYGQYIRRGGMGNVQTKRGCVFKCSYCTYPLLEGRRFRLRDAVDVVDEIEELQTVYGPHPLFFVDSIFNFPQDHAENICEEILRRQLKVHWSCYATPVKLDRRQAMLMAQAGCEGIELGTDAVDDEQLSRLGKSFDAETAEQANRYCMEAGLRVCQSIIFGAPGETPDTVHNTCSTLRKMQPTAVVAMTGVRVYPGTPLADTLVQQGHIQANDIGLKPLYYIDPAVRDFLPGYLQQHAYQAGNWVLPGLVKPILPGSQKLLRGLGISGPLWRLFHRPWLQHLYRRNFRRADTSWGMPQGNRKVIDIGNRSDDSLP